ncbi:IS1096 element passenger TnpR family protein [Massilia glaciei]|uniref:Plasmid pRiA4b Orf3-like domain-containing protein n=1 Tax=Massilia glaciei TaxID=1524097 RepID=A0A2U2HMQ4_9BURK|nr:hypothetical protein [Massilia glaciei]PWF48804.1 hypothetical protein C7C56_010035 [Massilia glaciei]
MSGIFTLSIECVGGMHLKGPYRFMIEAPVELTLGDLASHILGMVDFDGDHLAVFYLANGPRGRKTWFTPNGEWDDDDAHVMDMRLSAVFPLPKHKKLYFFYDFGASWCFQITKRGKETKRQPEIEYPCIVSETGLKPKEFGDDEDWDGDDKEESSCD